MTEWIFEIQPRTKPRTYFSRVTAARVEQRVVLIVKNKGHEQHVKANWQTLVGQALISNRRKDGRSRLTIYVYRQSGRQLKPICMRSIRIRRIIAIIVHYVNVHSTPYCTQTRYWITLLNRTIGLVPLVVIVAVATL